jgi:hypothetical protein
METPVKEYFLYKGSDFFQRNKKRAEESGKYLIKLSKDRKTSKIGFAIHNNFK